MKMWRPFSLLAVALPVVLVRGASTVAEESSAVAAVRAADAALVKTGCVDKNLEAFVGFWEPGGSVMAPNLPLASGTQAVREFFAPFFALPGFHCSWQPVQVEVAQSGELAYSRNTYRNGFTDPQGKPIEDRGNYATIWRRDAAGVWRLVLDTFASELAAKRE